MTTYTFKDLPLWKRKVMARADFTAKTATENTGRDANTPGNSVANPGAGAGGRLPVDTGFLQASFSAALNRMPVGQTKGDADGSYTYSAEALSAALLRWKPETGQTMNMGWTAEYARVMEARYGFMRGAAEVWPQQVRFAAKQAQLRFK